MLGLPPPYPHMFTPALPPLLHTLLIRAIYCQGDGQGKEITHLMPPNVAATYATARILILVYGCTGRLGKYSHVCCLAAYECAMSGQCHHPLTLCRAIIAKVRPIRPSLTHTHSLLTNHTPVSREWHPTGRPLLFLALTPFTGCLCAAAAGRDAPPCSSKPL